MNPRKTPGVDRAVLFWAAAAILAALATLVTYTLMRIEQRRTGQQIEAPEGVK